MGKNLILDLLTIDAAGVKGGYGVTQDQLTAVAEKNGSTLEQVLEERETLDYRIALNLALGWDEAAADLQALRDEVSA